LEQDMAKLMSKSELMQKIVAQHLNKVARKDVKAVFELLAKIGYKELNKSGASVLPGFAEFVVVKK
jgi:DNA-binding protein HU-beta